MVEDQMSAEKNGSCPKEACDEQQRKHLRRDSERFENGIDVRNKRLNQAGLRRWKKKRGKEDVAPLQAGAVSGRRLFFFVCTFHRWQISKLHVSASKSAESVVQAKSARSDVHVTPEKSRAGSSWRSARVQIVQVLTKPAKHAKICNLHT